MHEVFQVSLRQSMGRYIRERALGSCRRRAWSLAVTACLGLVIQGRADAGAPDAVPASYEQGRASFIGEMVERHGFDRSELESLLTEARYQREIVDAMDRPYEAQPWHRYRRIFLTPERIARGVGYWRTHASDLARAEETYGVPPQMIVAIIGIESLYGAHTGKHRALDALTTLGFSYPRRAVFFRGELESLLLLARDHDLDPARAMGSYAGALGRPQFIPSSYRAYAVDFDGDGVRDLWRSDSDVIGSVANYFARHGWGPDEPVAVAATIEGEPPPDLEIAEKKPVAPNTTTAALRIAGVDWREPLASDVPATLIRLDGQGDEYWVGLENFYAITRYNHSNLYAMAAHQLAQAIRERMLQGGG